MSHLLLLLSFFYLLQHDTIVNLSNNKTEFQVYSEENRDVFPMELAELCDIVARYLGYVNFKAEAAIVNYYHMGSTLSAHTDHSEVNLEAPLFSFR